MLYKNKKVALFQHVTAHYREGIYRELCSDGNQNYIRLFSEKFVEWSNIEQLDPEYSDAEGSDGGIRWTFIESRRFLRRFVWQSHFLKVAISKDYGCIVCVGNVYFLSTWLGAIISRLLGKKVIFWTHGYLRKESGFKGFLRMMFYSLADLFLVYGERGKVLLVEMGFSPSKTLVVYNSLDYCSQVKLRERWERTAIFGEFFKEADLPALIFIGRLSKRKKLNLLFDALNKASRLGYHFNLLFVGDGDDGEELISECYRLGLHDCVYFYGASYSEVRNAQLIGAADICVAPGGVGLTCIHALTYGTPVVTHENPDFQMPEFEAIIPKHNGDLFEYGNIDDLVKTLISWVESNPDRDEVRQRCYEVVDRHYNPKAQREVFMRAISTET